MPLPELNLPSIYTPEEKEFIQTGKAPSGAGSFLTPPPDDAATLPISSTLDKPAVERQTGKESPFKNPEFLGLLLAGLGDMIGSLAQGKPSTTALESTMKIQDTRRKQKAEERAVATEERKAKMAEQEHKLKIAQFSQSGTKAQFDNLGTLLTSVDKMRARMTNASPDEKAITVGGLNALAAKNGLDFMKPFLNKALDPAIPMENLGDMYQFIKDKPVAGLFLQNVEGFTKDPVKWIGDLKTFASNEAINEISKRVPAFTAKLKEQYKDRPIPFDVVRDLIAPESPYLKSVFAGGVPLSNEAEKAFNQVLSSNGVELPGLAAKKEEAKALETARKEAAQPFEKTPEEKAKEAGLIETSRRKAAQPFEEGKRLTQEQANQRMTTLAQDFSRLEMGKGINPIELMQATILAKDDPEIARRIKLGDPQIVEYSKEILRNEMGRLSKEYGISLPQYPGSAAGPGAKKPASVESVKKRFGLP